MVPPLFVGHNLLLNFLVLLLADHVHVVAEDDPVDGGGPLGCFLLALGQFEAGGEIPVLGEVQPFGHVQFLVGLPHWS